MVRYDDKVCKMQKELYLGRILIFLETEDQSSIGLLVSQCFAMGQANGGALKLASLLAVNGSCDGRWRC